MKEGDIRGNDIAKLAKNIPVSPQALRKRINYWRSTDPAINQLSYLEQRTILITLDDFILINQRLKETDTKRSTSIEYGHLVLPRSFSIFTPRSVADFTFDYELAEC